MKVMFKWDLSKQNCLQLHRQSETNTLYFCIVNLHLKSNNIDTILKPTEEIAIKLVKLLHSFYMISLAL